MKTKAKPKFEFDAEIWFERVGYIECPDCEHATCLGTDVFVDLGEVLECEECGADLKVSAVVNDE